jgi:AcrR family transcriptional regulator
MPADKTSNRTRIIDAAGKLMADKGVKLTTLADIAREAGISRGTLFYYYASKNDLIYDILEKHLSDLTDAIFASLPRRRSSTADLASVLQSALTGLIQDENSGRINLYLLQEAIIDNSDLKDRFAVKYQTWRELIAGQIARAFGISDSRRLQALGTLLLAMIDGLTIQFLLAPQSVNFQEISQQMVSMISAGGEEAGHDGPKPHKP